MLLNNQSLVLTVALMAQLQICVLIWITLHNYISGYLGSAGHTGHRNPSASYEFSPNGDVEVFKPKPKPSYPSEVPQFTPNPTLKVLTNKLDVIEDNDIALYI